MNLICMSFDGDYVTEQRGFDSVDEAWRRSSNMGSRWYFYPFHFVTTDSGKSIKDAPYPLESFVGQRVSTIARRFKEVSECPELQGIEPYEFSFAVLPNLTIERTFPLPPSWEGEGT